ncbi:hypothetical protein Ancab_029663 [Ancistrocladus abbreviatus]
MMLLHVGKGDTIDIWKDSGVPNLTLFNPTLQVGIEMVPMKEKKWGSKRGGEDCLEHNKVPQLVQVAEEKMLVSFDAAIANQASYHASILRNVANIVQGASIHVVDMTKPAEVEAFACLHAIQLARSHGFNKIIVFSVCKVVLDSIAG